MASRKRPTPNKSSKETPVEKQTKQGKERLHISVTVPSLSGMNPETTEAVLSEVKTNIFNSINDAELQRSLDDWARKNQSENKIEERDYYLLKSVITEYLDSFMLFGYNMKGERIIVQHAQSSRDKDAIMEFLKTIFIQQQQTNFLDAQDEDGGYEDGEDDEEELD
jgi:hypothetical protein